MEPLPDTILEQPKEEVKEITLTMDEYHNDDINELIKAIIPKALKINKTYNMKVYMREYRQKKRARIQALSKVPITCVCGRTIVKGSKFTHEKSEIHKLMMRIPKQ